ncbi:MAG TPA: DUF4346 domain-containing protein [Candidatus Nanoarchaeia archaeon]|nr:DUF4346 domain-containing protein [Candidatus Nanoarchaeia archaeon]
MIVIPKTKDRHHKDVLIENVKEIKARRFNGNFAKEPKGFFLIKVENNMIKAGKVFNGKMIEVVSGKNAQDIFYEIIKRKMIARLDTAGYLGMELMRAEYCLKSGKKYIQK